jgi:hypothetical protein
MVSHGLPAESAEGEGRTKKLKSRLREALWLHDASLMPGQFTDLRLCRTFGWLPDELDRQDASRIRMFIALMNAESSLEEFSG